MVTLLKTTLVVNHGCEMNYFPEFSEILMAIYIAMSTFQVIAYTYFYCFCRNSVTR